MERLKTIGVLMDFIVPGVIDGAGAYAREHGLRIDARWSVRADWMPDEIDWDGALVHLVDSGEMHRRVAEFGPQVVHLSGWVEGSIPRVEPDYRAIAARAVGEFRELGLRRVGGLDSRINVLGRRCFLGVQVAARRNGLEFVAIPRWTSGKDIPDGARWVADQLAQSKHPLGVFLPHAGFTFSLLEELSSRGVRVPDDVAVIVIDKGVQRTAELAPVPLTGVLPDDWQQGYEAARLVHRLIDGERIEHRIVRIPPARIIRRESTGVDRTRDPVVARALHAIREWPITRVFVKGLTDYAGVSRRTLEQRFRRETGRTLHEAITRRRIAEAKRLLRAGALSVAQVAEAAGYSSVHYFSTAFKRATGETPGGYRKRRS